MKVKIDVKKIYDSFTPSDRFKKFIEENKDKVFTAIEYARNKSVGCVFYTLKEDKQDPPWIFNGIYLIKIDE